MNDTIVERLWDSGLPAALPASVRRKRLLERCAPAWSLVAVFVLGRVLLLRSFSEKELEALATAPDDGLDVDAIGWAVLAVLVVAIVVPLLVWALLKVLPPRASAVVGGIILVFTVLSPGIGTLATVSAPGAGNFRDNVSVLPVVTVLVFVYLGWGRLLTWTLRRSLYEVAESLARAIRTLPLLLVAFLFFFYNAELWQLGVRWTVGRALLVAALFWGFGVVASFIVVNEHVREVIEGDARLPLRLRWNLRWVAASVQAAQASFFGVLVFLGFVFLGMVSVPEATIKTWTGAAPALVEIGKLAIPGALVKVSWVLGGFASLYMVTATAADKAAREDQLGPITGEVRSVLGDAGILDVGKQGTGPRADGEGPADQA